MKTLLRIALLYALMLPFSYATIAQTGCGWKNGDLTTRTQLIWDGLTSWYTDYNSVYSSTQGIVEIGIPGSLGFSLRFTAGDRCNDFFIQSGTPAALNADLLDSTTSPAGQFGGEMLALQLNVDFSDAGKLPASSTSKLGNLIFFDMSDGPVLNGMSVRQLLSIGNTLLGGNSSGRGLTIAYVNMIAARLNTAFVDGTPSQWAQEHLTKGWMQGDIVTYSQAAYGADPNRNVAAILLSAQFGNVYGNFFEIGLPFSSGYSLVFTSASALLAFLPQAFDPGILDQDLVNPTESSSETFGGETAALKLNIDFNDYDLTPSTYNVKFGDLILHDLSLTSLNGVSVRGFLDIAQNALGGGSTPYNITDLSNLAGSLNGAFRGGIPTQWAQDHLKKPWQQGDIVTYSQVQYGGSPSTSTAAALLDANFGIYLSFFEIGLPANDGFSIVFTNGTALLNYLPASGAPAALNNDLLNTSSSSSGEFGGEVAALKLNIDFNDLNLTGSTSDAKFGDLLLYDLSIAGLNSLSVREFLTIAHNALGGGSTAFAISDLSSIANSLNAAFLGGSVSQFAHDHLISPCDIAPPSNTPPTFVSPTPACGSTIEAKVGQETTFTIQASDTDAGDTATISVSGLPVGATLNPALPTDSTVFTWTPDANGQVTMTFTATDNSNETATCELTINVTTCPEGGGFWKNNPDEWPLQSLMLGTNSYSQAQLTAILDMPVGIGNKADASLILCRQLIPAKLSVASGAIVEPWLPTAIASADALIGSSTIPMNIKANSPLGKQMTAVASQLETFNNGSTTSGCGTVTTAAMVAMRSASDDATKTPSSFSLEQNIPNPFSESTIIRYGLPEDSYVQLAVYNFIGQHVRTLANGRQAAGYRQVEFNASSLADGIYFCRMQSGDFTSTIKLVLMK